MQYLGDFVLAWREGLTVETVQDGQILGLVWGQEKGLTEELWNVN